MTSRSGPARGVRPTSGRADLAMTQSPKRTGQLLAAYALSAAGGVFFFLGWAGFGIWPLELVALVPLWAAIELEIRRSWKTAFGLGLLFGTVVMAGGYHWILEPSRSFSEVSVLANLGLYAACAMFLGLQYAIQGVLYRAIRLRGWTVASAGLSSLLVTEWLFPRWYPAYMGNALQHEPLLAQTADLGGPLLISGVVCMCNVAVFEALRASCGLRKNPTSVLATAIAVLALCLVYGVVRVAQVDQETAAAPSIELGLVQANVGILAMREDPLASHRQHIRQSHELELQGDVDLLVWPESAYYPWLWRRLPFIANEVRRELRSPLLFGALSFSYDSGHRKLYNTVFLSHVDGLIGQLYDKNHLMAGAEYLPFGERFPFLYQLAPAVDHRSRGSNLNPIVMGPWRIATPVCYEAILPGFVRKMVNQTNPHILVNLSSDGLFRDSQAPWIHLQLAQLRAIEHRRYLVRATDTGVSAIIDPVGRIVSHTGVQTRENLRAEVHMMQGKTVYARLGDWPGWLSLVLAGLLLVRRPRRPPYP